MRQLKPMIWLDDFKIEGDLAGILYGDRDETDLSTIYWPHGLLPKEQHPEILLAVDSDIDLLARAEQLSSNQCVVEYWFGLLLHWWLSDTSIETRLFRILCQREYTQPI